jgi:hypothetical protein
MRAGLKDVYSAPTLKFRINRKSVGIEFDEYDDVNVSFVCLFVCLFVCFFKCHHQYQKWQWIENMDVGMGVSVCSIGLLRLRRVAD